LTTQTLPQRSEIPDKYKWNDKSVFADRDAWQAEFDSLLADLPEIDPYRGHLADSAENVLKAFAIAEQMLKRVYILYVYASLSHAVNTPDQSAAEMNGKATGLAGRAFAAFAFIDPELIAIGQPKLNQWTEQEPRLKIYAQYFDNLFRKQAHVRSAEVEELMGLVSDAFSGAYSSYNMMTSADMKFAPAVGSDKSEFEVAQGTITTILDNPDREMRRTGWQNYRDVYFNFKNTSAAQLETSIKQNVFQMHARHFNSTLEMAMDDQNLPVSVFHNLIATFKANLPTWHRYWRIRRKALGVDALRTYDIWSPLTSETKHISYEDAVDWICKGLAPMGQE
jgi:oligoendopeptidase F